LRPGSPRASPRVPRLSAPGSCACRGLLRNRRHQPAGPPGMRKAYCEDHVVSGTDFSGSAGVSPAAFTTFAFNHVPFEGAGYSRRVEARISSCASDETPLPKSFEPLKSLVSERLREPLESGPERAGNHSPRLEPWEWVERRVRTLTGCRKRRVPGGNNRCMPRPVTTTSSPPTGGISQLDILIPRLKPSGCDPCPFQGPTHATRRTFLIMPLRRTAKNSLAPALHDCYLLSNHDPRPFQSHLHPPDRPSTPRDPRRPRRRARHTHGPAPYPQRHPPAP
jgi:hypothetical protein